MAKLANGKGSFILSHKPPDLVPDLLLEYLPSKKQFLFSYQGIGGIALKQVELVEEHEVYVIVGLGQE